MNPTRTITIVTVLFICGALVVTNPVCAEQAAGKTDPLIDWLTLGGAALAFLIGLLQYRRGQRWKRVALAAKEMKEMLADTKAATALTMIDWASRNFKLKAIYDRKSSEETRVTIEDQWIALLPHTFNAPKRSPDPSSSQSSDIQNTDRSTPSMESTQTPPELIADEQVSLSRDGSQFRGYNVKETAIRDCYDALLDRLDRLGSYLRTGLLTVEDMRPYIGYYINDIAAEAKSPAEAIWSVSLLTYIYFYHFDGIPYLFKRFGLPILPDEGRFEAFVDGTANRKEIACQLQAVAKAECEDTRRLFRT